MGEVEIEQFFSLGRGGGESKPTPWAGRKRGCKEKVLACQLHPRVVPRAELRAAGVVLGVRPWSHPGAG